MRTLNTPFTPACSHHFFQVRKTCCSAVHAVSAVIPPFHDAVDNAVGQLAQDGLLGVADFFVSGKYDTPMRQMHWGRRFFWR
jgi:hypothetical protein